MITNTDITIFRRQYDPETRQDVWSAEYVPEAWWFRDNKASVTTDGLKTADVYTVRIPDITVSVKRDDYIVKGEFDVEMHTVKDLNGYEKLKVTAANYNTFGSNPHIKIKGA